MTETTTVTDPEGLDGEPDHEAARAGAMEFLEQLIALFGSSGAQCGIRR
jgi:hypothetical protein